MLRSIAEFFKNIWRAQWLAVEVLMLKEERQEAQFEADRWKALHEVCENEVSKLEAMLIDTKNEADYFKDKLRDEEGLNEDLREEIRSLEFRIDDLEYEAGDLP